MDSGSGGIGEAEVALAAAAGRAAAAAAAADAAPPPRAAVAAAIDGLAAAAAGTPTTAGALAALARFTRGEWPDDSELPSMQRLGEDLAGAGRAEGELGDEAVARIVEAEAARSQVAADLVRLLEAGAAAPPAGDFASVCGRLEALETAYANVQVKVERGLVARAHLAEEHTAMRTQVGRAEAESAALRRRVAAVEAQLAHIERILEAAAGFAAGGGRDGAR